MDGQMKEQQRNLVKMKGWRWGLEKYKGKSQGDRLG